MSAHPDALSSPPSLPIRSATDRADLTPAPDTSIREPTGSFENLGDAFPRRAAEAVGVGDKTGVQREDDVGGSGGMLEDDVGRTPPIEPGSGVVYLILWSVEGAISTSCHPRGVFYAF